MKKTITVITTIITGLIATTGISCDNQLGTIPQFVITEGPSLPRGRGGHAAATLDGHVFVAGGTDWSSDHTTKSWLSDSVVFINGSWQSGPALAHPVAYSMFAGPKRAFPAKGKERDGISS